ncbi:MAG: purine-nucleoside phosphorylase [Clostridiales bacterium]|jgi:purine-nucleoside phosphorylase|nr:purine-nucleoside phosphorylase [Clostridiales bacterium]
MQSNQDYLNKIVEASEAIKQKISITPKVAIVLGSGLGTLAASINNPTEIKYSDIPNFFEPSIDGHKGSLIFGELGGVNIVAQCGRFHHYEGHSMRDVALPIAVYKMLGVKTVILTNAAGGVNPNFNVPSLMLIRDHISLDGDNPLMGEYIPELGGERFTDMTNAYTPQLIQLALSIMPNLNVGVYAYRKGPMFETPAEIKMLSVLGADAVGMSTAPEAIMATHCGMDLMGISCITNKAAGLGGSLAHVDVLAAGNKMRDDMINLIIGVLESIKAGN